jgi:hypothetical protein
MGLREDYQATMEKQLNDWKVQAEHLKVGFDQMEVSAKDQYNKSLEMLRVKQGEAWENFDKLKSASESAWGQFRAGMDKAGGEVKSAIENMSSSFKK